MSPNERKAAFRSQADKEGLTLNAAAFQVCGVTWFHLSQGIQNPKKRPLSEDVKQKFAAYIGRPVNKVFESAA